MDAPLIHCIPILQAAFAFLAYMAAPQLLEAAHWMLGCLHCKSPASQRDMLPLLPHQQVLDTTCLGEQV